MRTVLLMLVAAVGGAIGAMVFAFVGALLIGWDESKPSDQARGNHPLYWTKERW